MGLTTMRVMQQAIRCNRTKQNIIETEENTIERLHKITRIQTNSVGVKTKIKKVFDKTTQDERH